MIGNESKAKGARAEDRSEAQVLEEIPRLTGESLEHGQVAVDRKIKILGTQERTASADARKQCTKTQTSTLQMIVLPNSSGRP
jgi:hypothetical protein